MIIMSNDSRTVVLNLMNRKAEIENEIKELGTILTQNGIGMSEPLVDAEGYPLAHVDVYRVRLARNRIICLQNDHKAIMKEIEVGLGQYYGTNASSNRVQNQTTAPISTEHSNPFAKVNDVLEGSPANEAGLNNEDMILEFGSVNANNFRDMSTIANVVKHSENAELSVWVQRGTRIVHLKLRPHKWTGRGLLGCNIAPLEFIDR